MSGTLIVDFSKQSDLDDLKHRFNTLAPKGGNLIPPHIEAPAIITNWLNWLILPDPMSRQRGMFVKIPDKIWGKKVASFDYAIWDQWSAQFGYFFGLELIKRYKIKRIGWDSVGWCKIEEYKESRGFGNARRSLKYITSPDDRKVARDYINKVCRIFRQAAKRFFDGGSDLILACEPEETSHRVAES